MFKHLVQSHNVYILLYSNGGAARSFKPKSATARVWAINKIDHAPELPFARDVGSVRARNKEPAQRIDGEKKTSREDEESPVRASRHKGINICLRSVLQ